VVYCVSLFRHVNHLVHFITLNLDEYLVKGQHFLLGGSDLHRIDVDELHDSGIRAKSHKEISALQYLIVVIVKTLVNIFHARNV
jgi:hypothetical protein